MQTVLLFNCYMEKISITRARKLSSSIKKIKKKYISLDMLSRNIGVYSDVLGQELAYFEPMILMDPDINLVTLPEKLDAYADELEAQKAPSPKKVVVRSQELDEYKDTSDYIYRHLTGAGGLFYPSYKMSEKELRTLNKLIERDLLEFAPKKKKKKGKSK